MSQMSLTIRLISGTRRKVATICCLWMGLSLPLSSHARELGLRPLTTSTFEVRACSGNYVSEARKTVLCQNLFVGYSGIVIEGFFDALCMSLRELVIPVFGRLGSLKCSSYSDNKAKLFCNYRLSSIYDSHLSVCRIICLNVTQLNGVQSQSNILSQGRRKLF